MDLVEQKGYLWKDKASVPGKGPKATVGTALLSPERHVQVLDVNPYGNTPFADVQAAVLAEFAPSGRTRFADLAVNLDRQFLPQWHAKYFSQIMPFEIPRMVSGPDYPRRPRWRRVLGSPVVTPTAFLRAFSRRVELQIANSWTAVPIVRSVWYKRMIEARAAAVGSFKASVQDAVCLEALGPKMILLRLWKCRTA